MELKKLTLNNFCCYEDAEVDFNKVNIFYGVNESGKTALVDAINFCLVGVCRSMVKIGSGTENLIMNGKDSMGVKLLLQTKDGTVEITRSYIRTVGQDISIKENDVEKVLGMADKQKYITGLFGGDIKIIKCLFDSFGFFTLSVEEQKRLLTVISGVEMDKATVIKLIEKQFGKEIAAYAIKKVPDNIDMSKFKSFLKQLMDARAENNKKIPAQDDKTNTIDTVVNEARKLEVKTRLDEIKTALEKQRSYIDTQNKINGLKSEKNGYKNEPVLSLLPIEKDVQISEKSFIQQRLAALQKYKKEKADYDTVESALKLLKEKEGKILSGFCELTNTNCDKLLSGTDNTELLEELQGKIKVMSKAKPPKEIEDVDKEIEEINGKLNKITIAEGLTAQNKTLKTNYDNAVLARKKNIDRIDNQIKELEKIVNPNIDIVALQTEKDELNNELGRIESAERNVENNRNLATMKKSLQEESDNLTKLIQFFSGKQGGEDSSAKFLEYVNQASKILLEGEIVMSPEWDLYLVRNNVDNPVANCSYSVKLRVGLALIYAIATMTGLPLASVDNFESVTKSNKNTILSFLKATKMQGILRIAEEEVETVKPSKDKDITKYKFINKGQLEIVK